MPQDGDVAIRELPQTKDALRPYDVVVLLAKGKAESGGIVEVVLDVEAGSPFDEEPGDFEVPSVAGEEERG